MANPCGPGDLPIVRTVSSWEPRGIFRRQLAALLPQGGGHLGERDVERPHDVRIELNLDLAVRSADQLHLADTTHALEPLLDLLVGDLREVAHRQIAADGNLQDRHGARIELLNDRRFGRFGERGRDQRDPIADFLGGDVPVLFEQERDVDLRDAFDRARAELVDAADRVDRA
jgi:hypothetical protein